jgi:carbon dioxide concentrating mechanism protein CcmN
MRSPALVLMNDSHLCMSGDVVIHPTAAIASGVLLQADPGCRVVVEAGVCIGSGSILHANQGNVVIGSGAVLGSGILVVGKCSIGENACIGSLTTILNSSVAPKEFVPAESLLGDRSRQVELTDPAEPQTKPQTKSQAKSQTSAQPDRNGSTPYAELESPWASPSSTAQTTAPQAVPNERSNVSPPDPAKPESSKPNQPIDQPVDQPAEEAIQQVVYGRAYIEKMMIRMFPQRQAIDPPNSPN